jgi:hypothetical protein
MLLRMCNLILYPKDKQFIRQLLVITRETYATESETEKEAKAKPNLRITF